MHSVVTEKLAVNSRDYQGLNCGFCHENVGPGAMQMHYIGTDFSHQLLYYLCTMKERTYSRKIQLSYRNTQGMEFLQAAIVGFRRKCSYNCPIPCGIKTSDDTLNNIDWATPCKS
jgi:hypothetical protein